MKGYTRSYILGGILIVAAFITLFIKTGLLPEKNKTASWFLFVGGAVLVVAGWKEQNEKNKKNK
ncbi:MAG TPA: hypothetical protein VI461_16525 [Chitinophagaceae bacterium]|nr:hypothetical protein [Chitinophagaceae bacterium]